MKEEDGMLTPSFYSLKAETMHAHRMTVELSVKLVPPRRYPNRWRRSALTEREIKAALSRHDSLVSTSAQYFILLQQPISGLWFPQLVSPTSEQKLKAEPIL